MAGEPPCSTVEVEAMPTVRANNVNLYYEKQGNCEPLVLIPEHILDKADCGLLDEWQASDQSSKTCQQMALRSC